LRESIECILIVTIPISILNLHELILTNFVPQNEIKNDNEVLTKFLAPNAL